MQIIQTVRDMQAHAEQARRSGRRLALVPTMGALHAGHLKLVKEAATRADHVTVSIFVNPTQFGPGEDFERYPRDLDADLAALERTGGVDAVFTPPVAEMYPPSGAGEGSATWVAVEELDRHLLGSLRPGHFRGVTTVVAKLFLACKPHLALFGLKDAQQFVILRRMARDLLFDVEMVGVPTEREADGLAMSSRNVYLSPSEQAQAVVLSRAVREAERRILSGEQRVGALVETMLQALKQAPDARIEYAEVVDAVTLRPADALIPGTEVLAAVAVLFGRTRLIDSTFVRVPG